MAKKARDETGAGDGHGVSAIRGNGFDKDMIEGFVKQLLEQHDKLSDIAVSRMKDSKDVRGTIREIFDDAKSAGVPRKSLRGIVTKILLERKIEGIREKLEGDDQDAYDQLEQALGILSDLPLGQAALSNVVRIGNEQAASAT